MSARWTALRVIRWAIEPAGPPPRGDLAEPLSLAAPDEALRSGLQEMTAIAAARLRLGPDALGADRTLGIDALLVAGAIGAATTPEIGIALLDTFPLATTLAEWIARDALVGPALAHLPAPLAGQLLALSPLTGLLQHPAPGQAKSALRVAHRLLQHTEGRSLLRDTLTTPTPDLATRDWRSELLQRLRTSPPPVGAGFVLDVYEAALCFRPAPWLAQVRAALEVLTAPPAGLTDRRLEDALSIAHWWSALRDLERIQPEALRQRLDLGYDYRAGIALYQLADRLAGDLP